MFRASSSSCLRRTELLTGTFTESVVEEAALDWLESLGWTVKQGAEIAPGELDESKNKNRTHRTNGE